MLLFPTYTPRYRSLSGLMAFFVVLFLLFCGAENGLASKAVYFQRLSYQVKGSSSGGWATAYNLYHYSLSSAFKPYEFWPFLTSMRNSYSTANSLYWWWPYGYLEPGYGNDPPYLYASFGQFGVASQVPDDWTEDDVDNLVNIPYSKLTTDQRSALSGTFVGGNRANADGSSEKFVSFNTRTQGTITSTGGLVTYDQSGVASVSYPDGYGVISGYKLLPNGTTTPVYYTISDGQAVEHTSYPVTDFSNLDTDDQGNYTLSVPDYSGQLNQIIKRIDNIDLHIPDINVNPEVNVTVPPPEVTVELPDSISDSLTDIQASLDTVVSNTSVTGSVSSAENFSDLEMSSEEQSLVNDLVSWETNIPLIGEAVDFGLTAIMGKIPSVGTEYVWLDYTIGGSSAGASGRRGLASSSNPLNGYRVLVSLANYQDLLQATRGTLILFEALYFVVLIFKLIHKALLV